jgi:hypothetical protein
VISTRQPAGIRFCTYCAAREGDLDGVEALLRRVCPRCELGVLLTASHELVAAADGALLVVTADLRIGAASAAVEPILGDPEPLVGSSLPALLEGDGLATRVAACALGAAGVSLHRVEAGGRAMTARVGACGTPPAALVVLCADESTGA